MHCWRKAWDLGEALERAMFAAAEKRYDMSTLRKSHKKVSQEDFASDQLNTSRDKKSKSSDFSKVCEIKIKVEKDPDQIKFKQGCNVMKSGKGFSILIFICFASLHVCFFLECNLHCSDEGVLAKLLTEAEDLTVQLNVKGDSDASGILNDKVVVLRTFMDRLRTMLARCDSIKKEDITQSLLEDIEQVIAQGVAHKEGIRESIHKAKAVLGK